MEQRRKIGREKGISVADKEFFVEEHACVPKCAARAGRAGFFGDRDFHFDRQTSEDARQRGTYAVGAEAGQQYCFFNPEAGQFAQQPGQEWAAGDRQQRFWCRSGEASQTRAKAAHHDGTLTNHAMAACRLRIRGSRSFI
jgi:hypothetical protein